MLHINVGDCLTVNFTNQRALDRASFSVGELAKSGASSGVNVGFNSEQTVAPGESQTYKVYADNESIEAAQFSDFGGDATGKIGLYGAIVVHEAGAWFTNLITGAPMTRVQPSTFTSPASRAIATTRCSCRTPIRRSAPTSCRIRSRSVA